MRNRTFVFLKEIIWWYLNFLNFSLDKLYDDHFNFFWKIISYIKDLNIFEKYDCKIYYLIICKIEFFKKKINYLLSRKIIFNILIFNYTFIWKRFILIKPIELRLPCFKWWLRFIFVQLKFKILPTNDRWLRKMENDICIEWIRYIDKKFNENIETRIGERSY